MSAVIVASGPAFLALRFAGAAYLIYLGARLLLVPKDKLLPAAPAGGEDETPARAGRPRAFRRGFLCEMTNPKTLLVFTSVIPQFIPAGSAPFLPALLGVTFAALGFASLTLYSLVLGRAGGVLRRPRLARRRVACCAPGRGQAQPEQRAYCRCVMCDGRISILTRKNPRRLIRSPSAPAGKAWCPACDDTLPGPGSF